jgi:hypothetical protein
MLNWRSVGEHREHNPVWYCIMDWSAEHENYGFALQYGTRKKTPTLSRGRGARGVPGR